MTTPTLREALDLLPPVGRGNTVTLPREQYDRARAIVAALAVSDPAPQWLSPECQYSISRLLRLAHKHAPRLAVSFRRDLLAAAEHFDNVASDPALQSVDQKALRAAALEGELDEELANKETISALNAQQEKKIALVFDFEEDKPTPEGLREALKKALDVTHG